MRQKLNSVLVAQKGGWKKGTVIKWIQSGKLFLAPEDTQYTASVLVRYNSNNSSSQAIDR